MIKILHTGDVHLGAKLNWLGPKSEVQRQQLMSTFERIIDTAIKKKVDVLLIAGDLFDTYSPNPITLSFVKSQLERLKAHHIYTALIPGNHDRLEPNSVFLNYDLVDIQFGHCFKEVGCKEYKIKELDLSIYGYAIEKQFAEIRPLKETNEFFAKNQPSKFNVAIVHGSLQINNSTTANYPILTEDISDSKFDYIAIGDWHGTLDATNIKTAWYCGSPEMISKSQQNCGHVLYVEVGESGAKVEQIRIGKRKSENLKIDIEKYKNDINQELISELNLKADPDLILTVELTGKRSTFQQILFEQIKELLSDKFFHLEILDYTSVRITEADLARYPESTLVGRYVKNIKAELNSTENAEERDIIEEALFEGIQRILNSNKT